ncbi:MAG: tetratricopeptide repeat protein [Promethearchaeota archaeon]
MRPFSFQERNTISKLLEEIGFRKELTPQNCERYSIINDSTIALTIKIPISIGVKLNIPFEVVSFYNSFFFRPRLLNSKVLEMINFLAVNLLNFSQNVALEHYFPIDAKKNEFIKLLNKFMPEKYQEEEKQWISRVRVSLMNKYSLFQDLESNFFNKLYIALEKIGLKPSWRVPISLNKGIPRPKKESVLFYSAQKEEEKEFFIAEKGFFTFLKDFESNRIQIRVAFETYTPLLLELIFGGNGNKEENSGDILSIHDLILSWIRFSRMVLNPLVKIINSDEYINGSELFEINLQSFLRNEIPGGAILIPALTREILSKETLFKPSRKLFNNPPRSFTELKVISKFDDVEKVIQNGKLQDAAEILTQLLITLNRYGHKRGVIHVLFKLAKIGKYLKNYKKTQEYLNNALDICKSGEIPKEMIIKVHDKLGNLFFEKKEYKLAEKHFQIIEKFLSNENFDENIITIQKNRLKIIKTLIESYSLKKSNQIFKKILKDKIVEQDPDLMIEFYLVRANYFLKKDSKSKMVQTLRKGILFYEKLPPDTIINGHNLAKIYFEMAKIYLFERKAVKIAKKFLLSADEFLDERKTEDLFLKIEIYDILSESFNKAEDYENMRFYSDRTRQIINQLRLRGLY